ncbi:uncharacterized protein K02A2.6-like [Amphibalanus amphitrite]|uniref:uncharacterized protein K02A2.6-like n=1 Tax=Amphibalanus amphitrite TaxID=1232801 RepID=UPI001C920B6C|nr:uncharacterized protein K02A2.6-like [Amphibalanus amphitrite]
MAASLGVATKMTGSVGGEIKFSSAGSTPLTCIGQFSAAVTFGDCQTATTVYVLREVTGFLLGWCDSVRLRILPANFPAQIPVNIWRSQSVPDQSRGSHVRSQSIGARPLQRPDRPPAPPVDEHLAPPTGHPLHHVAAARAAGGTGTSAGGTEAPAGDTGAAAGGTGAAAGGTGTTAGGAGAAGSSTKPSSQQTAASAQPVWEHEYDPSDDVIRGHEAALRQQFKDVFDGNETLCEMAGGPMVIDLTDDAVPTALTAARNIPYCWREEIKSQLDDLVARGIVAPVNYPTEWCHPMVPIAKRQGGARLVVDMTAINGFVKRPAYPVRPIHDAVASIDGDARWLTTLDAAMGYFQVPIAEESQDLTCFITPWGRMKFLRAPMGLISSGDEYNRRGDAALGDIPRTLKIVDDLLLHDATYSAHLSHVVAVLRRCRETGITINPRKFQFARPSLDYCGYRISEQGYTVDDRKLQAISEFPRPENLTDLRSFLGLANQLADFSADIASAAQPLRDLLKQHTVWRWTEQHEEAFKDVKRALVSPPVLAFFDPQLPTKLQTDSARTRGLGFVLQQRHGDTWKMVQCGSRFLTDTESRYAVVELECLACLWALRKCHIFLAGLPQFDLIVDHRPLVPILNSKRLSEIDNPRLQRMREKMSIYSFTAVWQKGASHCIPDALSRAPVSDPATGDEVAEVTEALHDAVVATLSATSEDGVLVAPLQDRTLDSVRAAAARDPEYRALRDVILAGFPDHRHDVAPALRPYWGVRSMLAVDDGLIVYGARLVIPASLRRNVLDRLHDSHQGMEKTKRRSRLSVYWPGIDRDICNTVSACQSCRQLAASHSNEPLWMEDDLPSRVFESVSADYFYVAGRTYLVYVDRLSGWPYVTVCPRTASADHLVKQLRRLFSQTGVPTVLRTDGGPQFASSTLRRFLDRWGVRHEMSSPRYPRSNGHAEAAVKTVKKIIVAASASGRLDDDQLDRGLLELRNTPRADGRSPAQTLFGHPLRSGVPTHHRAYAPEWQRAADACDARAADLRDDVQRRHDATARPLSGLRVGCRVDVQSTENGRWDRTGVIVGVGQRRTYLVKMPSGRIYWRNRRFLRPHRPMLASGAEPQPPEVPGAARAPPTRREALQQPPTRRTAAARAAEPRQSGRQRREPQRLQVRWDTNTYD